MKLAQHLALTTVVWAASIAATIAVTGVATAMLIPCQQEDWDYCHWDAEKHGNGQGRSFLTVAGYTIHTS